MVPLPKLTKELTRIYFIQITKLNAFCPKIILQKSLNLVEILSREDCVFNELMVMDMTNIKFEDYLKVTPTFFLQLSTIYEVTICQFISYRYLSLYFYSQKLCKMRLRGIYIINCKSYINKALSLIKPIMKAKLFNRVFI